MPAIASSRRRAARAQHFGRKRRAIGLGRYRFVPSGRGRTVALGRGQPSASAGSVRSVCVGAWPSTSSTAWPAGARVWLPSRASSGPPASTSAQARVTATAGGGKRRCRRIPRPSRAAAAEGPDRPRSPGAAAPDAGAAPRPAPAVSPKDLGGEQGGVDRAGLADGQGRHGNARRHLHGGEQRVEPLQGARLHRHAEHRLERVRRHDPGEMGGAAGGGDEHLDAVGLRLART